MPVSKSVVTIDGGEAPRVRPWSAGLEEPPMVKDEAPCAV
jgi:hypothetical protein